MALTNLSIKKPRIDIKKSKYGKKASVEAIKKPF